MEHVFEVLQPTIQSGNLKTPHKARERGGIEGRVRFQSSPEGQVRNLV